MNRVLHAYRPFQPRAATILAACFVLGGTALPARAGDDVPPPPPPPRPRSEAKGVVDPTSKDFRGALLGDSSSSFLQRV